VMIVRVAKAICRAQTQGEEVWQSFLPEASAAIAEVIAVLRDASQHESDPFGYAAHVLTSADPAHWK
jgi:hypothetical protein